MSKSLEKSFCIKPWVHAHVKTNNDYRLCCHSREKTNYNTKTHTIKEYWSNDFLKSVRTKMLDGVLPDECKKCQDDEQIGLTSLRQKTNSDYKIQYNYVGKILSHLNLPAEMPLDIECSLTNHCNLKCMMCNGKSSSSLLVENKILQLENLDQNDFNIQPRFFDELDLWLQSRPKILTFHGGETMIIPEVKTLLNSAVKKGYLDKTEIRMITNTTKFDREWFDLLQTVPNLLLMISIDGVGAVNDYIRYGSDWAMVNQAIKTMQQLKNARLIVNTTMQNLNILNFDQIISWSLDHDLFITFYELEYPEYLASSNFPIELLEQAKSRMQKHQNFSNKFISWQTIINAMNKAINTNSFDTNWSKFKNYIELKDGHRGNSILNVIPELRAYW